MVDFAVFVSNAEHERLKDAAETLKNVRETIEPLLRRLDECYPFDDCLDPKPEPLNTFEVAASVDLVLRAFGENPHKWRYGK